MAAAGLATRCSAAVNDPNPAISELMFLRHTKMDMMVCKKHRTKKANDNNVTFDCQMSTIEERQTSN